MKILLVLLVATSIFGVAAWGYLVITKDTTPHRKSIPIAEERAKHRLAAEKNLAYETIETIYMQSAQWQDTCLGTKSIAVEYCKKQVTPGYKFLFQIGSNKYIYRTDITGEVIYEQA